MRAVVVSLLLAALSSIGYADDDDYVLHHPDDARWWLSAQGNAIYQFQPGFHSPYVGVNSFRSEDNRALSDVVTVYAGYELTRTTAILIAPESAGGSGLSAALGLAGFTNLDVVRNPSLGPAPYIGRAYIEQVIPLSDHLVKNERDPLHSILRALPDHRIEIRAGKISLPDFFDQNEGATDSHKQFMNWTVDNNGAYDYAADTRGYTLGFEIEYVAPQWALRLGEFLMPTVANGIDYDFHVGEARGENLELEVHECIARRPGKVRFLAYANHADAGTYAESIALSEQLFTTPDITLSRTPGTLKYGFGLNGEQEIADDLHVFARVGWNDGQTESFAYTEVDNTVLVGGDLVGGRWGRPGDKLGLALVTNGISGIHREYLADGGLGFLLGDGKLHYGREDIVEAYYTGRAYRGVFPALDVQAIAHPGYNTDRGPVFVGSVRLHVEL